MMKLLSSTSQLKLSIESHKLIETFFRQHLKDGQFVMPPTRYFSGRLVGLFTSVFNIYAITLGRTILLAPQTIRKDCNGRLTMSGWLVVHEYCHVLQYDREGFFRFLFSYVAEYLRALRSSRKLDNNARFQAYASIKQEREADEIEKAYIEWSRQQRFNEQ